MLYPCAVSLSLPPLSPSLFFPPLYFSLPAFYCLSFSHILFTCSSSHSFSSPSLIHFSSSFLCLSPSTPPSHYSLSFSLSPAPNISFIPLSLYLAPFQLPGNCPPLLSHKNHSYRQPENTGPFISLLSLVGLKDGPTTGTQHCCLSGSIHRGASSCQKLLGHAQRPTVPGSLLPCLVQEHILPTRALTPPHVQWAKEKGVPSG